MKKLFVDKIPLQKFCGWNKIKNRNNIASFDLEITARCNNNCRHCFINLPANDKKAEKKELSLGKIKCIADEAVSLGALWCLLTGGEPLLRKDFFDIYIYLKKTGLLVSVFTNAALIGKKHIDLFKKYPPRDIEITVYGVTKPTYEKITRVKGSFDSFMRAIDLLFKNNINVRFKTMALRSNLHELPRISEFCRNRTKDYFRFDPFLNLRSDQDFVKNQDIKSERLSAEQIVTIEAEDRQRFKILKRNCGKLLAPAGFKMDPCSIFYCSAGDSSFAVSYDGFFKLCSSLCHPPSMYDLKKGSVSDAWNNFVIKVRSIASNRKEFKERCQRCTLLNLCMWCPANAYLETGELDTPVDYFCEVAHARADAIRK